MEERLLGRSGLKVSLVGVGCNDFGGRLSLETARGIVHRALDLGITLFDTADTYGNKGGSETCLGEILGDRRKDIVLATKFAKPMKADGKPGGGSRRYIMQAVEDSLRRLRTDWIDLYQMHEPDPGTPIEETLAALDDLVRAGKVRYVGCSNFSPWRVVEAHYVAKAASRASFICCQDLYNLLSRQHEQELFPAMRACGLGLLPFFPLASGMLTGKYRHRLPEDARLTQSRDGRFLNDANADRVEKLAQFAESRGHSILELAFSWLAHQPLVASIIAGASRPEQIDMNVAATAWKLSGEELAAIDALTLPSLGPAGNRPRGT